MSCSKAIPGDNANTQVPPPSEPERIPGYVKRKIREQKALKKPTARAPARACAREVLKQAAELADLLADQDVSGAIKVLRTGLAATKLMWDGNARDWVEQPDWKARHDCAMAILSYRFGKPVERQLQVTGTFEDLGQLFGRIQNSPAARRALEVSQASRPKIEEYTNHANEN